MYAARFALLAGLISVALILGFAGTVLLLPSGPLPGAVDWQVQFHSGVVYMDSLSSGWGAPRMSGVPAVGNRSVLTARLSRPAQKGMVELVLEARRGSTAQSKPPVVRLSVNEHFLGQWQLDGPDPILRRHVLVPPAIVAGKDLLKITLDHEKSGAILLRSVWLRDITRLGGDRGHVGRCTQQLVAGWATANGLGVPVRVLVNDKEVAWVSPSIIRKDLAKHGLPTDSGYQFRFPEPVHPEQTIRVTFPNGKDLHGSPCQA